MKKLLSITSNLQAHYHFKLDFPKADHHTGGKWLIHGTKHHNDSQAQRLEPPVEYPSREFKHDIKESEGNMPNPIFKDHVQRQKHPGRYGSAVPELPRYRKPKYLDEN